MRLTEELAMPVTGGAPPPHRTLRHAFAGSVLLDLALEGRIDTDSSWLWLVDDLLDPTLAETATETRSPEGWVRHVARGGDAISRVGGRAAHRPRHDQGGGRHSGSREYRLSGKACRSV